MKEKVRWAFIIEKDEFVRLSLKKILNKYGFKVEEIDNILQLEKRKKDIKEGVIVADLEIGEIEQQLPLLKKWNERLILMSPSITDEVVQRLKELGIEKLIKKPVEPNILKKIIKEISFPGFEIKG
jgi:DNA-binding NtrC family response regulator